MRVDEIEKIKHYKEVIIKDFIKKGIYPSNKEIDDAIKRIDLKISYYRTSQVNDGEFFDAASFNKQIEDLYRDLLLIYQLVKRFTYDQLNYLTNYAETELAEIEQQANFYLSKSRQEMNTTYLGETIYYAIAPFKGTQNERKFIIDCGTLHLTSGTQISMVLEGSNLELAKLKLASGENNYSLAPYAANRDTFKVPGTLKITTHTVELLDSSKFPYILPFTPTESKYYEILTGKNNVSVKTSNATDYKENHNIVCFNQCMVDFYVKDSKGVRIKTSKKPLKTNYAFTDDFIRLEKGIHHFYLQMPADSTLEIFLESGAIYAQKTKGIVKNNALLFNKKTSFKKFDIVEYDNTEKIPFNAQLELLSTQFSNGLSSILIKEALL